MELLQGSRRGRNYVFRWIYAGWLVLQCCFAALNYLAVHFHAHEPVVPFGDWFFELLVMQHFLVILLATPAFVAGAITDEKTRGTLQYLLTADLTPAEVVLGKLWARLAQVVLLILTGLPVLCFAGVFGGLDFLLLLGLIGVSALLLFSVGAASLLASVWSRTTRDAVLGLYAVVGILLFLYWLIHKLSESAIHWPGPLAYLFTCLEPFAALAPLWGRSDLPEAGLRLLTSSLVWGGIGGACLVLAIGRLRPAYIRQLENEGKKKRRWWYARRTEIAADPIRWKEQQVEGIAPLPVLRLIPKWLGVLAVFLLTVFSSATILANHLPGDITAEYLTQQLLRGDFEEAAHVFKGMESPDVAFCVQAQVVLFLASLVVALRCSGAVSGERERQTWEALLLTPLETRALVRGKLWGIIEASYPYLGAYAGPAVLLSLLGGPLSVFWTVIWLPVTWLALFYAGATGIWCSVRSKSSWRSLLGTLGFCYLGGLILSPFLAIAIGIVGLFIFLFLKLVDSFLHLSLSNYFDWKIYFIAMCLVLATCFWLASYLFLISAEGRISNLERTRHWKDEWETRRRRR